MGKLDKDIDGRKMRLSRRDFLKASAATAAVGAAGVGFAAAPSRAAAGELDFTYHTTCPYCSASCGQLVDVDADGNVLDIYGDHMAPWNSGGLCSKGAGTFQLVNNNRRLGAFANNPENPLFSYDSAYDATGVAYKRTGNDPWTKMGLQAAMDEAALAMVTARGDLATAPTQNNSKSIAFFGSSHMSNDENYLYRKIIANFGTSNIEHQARI